MSGTIVILNGVPRSGKSSIAHALQHHGTWINLGVDALMVSLPDGLQPGVGLRPGGEHPDLEPQVQRLYAALFGQLATYAREGFDVVSDLGLHDDYSRPLGIVADARRRLAGLPVLLIGVRCPIDVIMARRNADPKGGLYAGGDTVPAPVARWQTAVHRDMVYDLELDTSLSTPEQCAEAIAKLVSDWPEQPVLARS